MTGDDAFHNLLERPRDNPWPHRARRRASLVWVFSSSSPARPTASTVYFGLGYDGQIWAYRVLVWVVPLRIAFFVAKRVCEELLAGERAEKVRRAAEERTKAAFGRG